jgi:hypothetical protein
MDDETATKLRALKSISEELIVGLRTAIAVLENVDKFPEEIRQSVIESLKVLVATNQEANGKESKQH